MMAETPEIIRSLDQEQPDDSILTFQVEGLDVRGRVLRMGLEIDRLLKRHAYPEPVLRLLAEAVALTALLGTALKLTGRFQLQTKSDGPVSMLVVDFDAPGALRACAQFDTTRLAEAGIGSLLGSGIMGLTIDQGGQMNRYQGIVELDQTGLLAAAHRYFAQSEQIPTLIRIAVGEIEHGSGPEWRIGGLFLQFLPDAPERMRPRDLAPGDSPEGTAAVEEPSEDDAWTEARLLGETVEDHELLDPSLTSERLLYRLFNERGVRLFGTLPMKEQCRCSTARIREMLARFSPEEVRDMQEPSGKIGITCEFCSTHYEVDPAELESIS
jgi:molecular chaperone Hsp33